MKFSTRRRQGAYSLVELLVYCSVLIAILALGYTTLSRFWTSSARMRAHADDLREVLDAGEQWRLDVRTPGARISSAADGDTQVFTIQTDPDHAIGWAFRQGRVLRRDHSNAPWETRLTRVDQSSMTPELRGDIPIWRWDVELQPRTIKTRFRRPFTFAAVASSPALKP